MKPIILIPILCLGVTAAATATVIYTAWYAHKYGPKARTPLEAAVTARRHRKSLDTELAKILGPTESR